VGAASADPAQTLEKIEDRRKHLFDTYIVRMFKRRGKATQSYTTEKTISWLSWLAQNMRQYNQTVFFIEQIQPTWLLTRGQRWVYAFSSRLIGWLHRDLIWVLLLFILTPLSLMPPFSGENLVTYPETWKLISHLQGGLYAGLIAALRFEQNSRPSKLKKFLTFLLAGILFLNSSFSGMLAIWLIFVQRDRRRNVTSEIQTVETLSWSWKEARKNGVLGLVGGLISPAFVLLLIFVLWGALYIIEVLRVLREIIFSRDFHYFLILVLGLGLIIVILTGLYKSVVETKTLPNQGIKLSVKIAIGGGLIVGSMIGLIAGLITKLLMGLIGVEQFMMPQFDGSNKQLNGLNIGLLVGLFAGQLTALWYGGLDVIQHYTLRFILSCIRYTSWNYARFLDYAASLVFLQKVGGGYIFIHRLLLEHFAAMPLQSKTQKKMIQ